MWPLVLTGIVVSFLIGMMTEKFIQKQKQEKEEKTQRLWQALHDVRRDLHDVRREVQGMRSREVLEARAKEEVQEFKL